jgi:hypothetical protein
MIQVRPRGSTEFRNLTGVQTAADGTWSRRMTLTEGAAYRYLWTPKPTLLDPAPLPRISGVVDLRSSARSPIKAAAAVAE